jgi:hypothetical protein
VKAVAAGVGGLVLGVPLLLAAALGSLGAGAAPAGGVAPAPGAAPADVPPEMWALYTEAAGRFGVPAGLLAAVGRVESDHGRDLGSLVPNAAGAVGPMQFLPATFARWSWASGSPAPSILDSRDAVMASAAKLAADGAAQDPARAVFSYNHSDAVVAEVEAWALVYGWRPPRPGVLADAARHHPALAFRPEALGDLDAGAVDDAVIADLLVAATRHRLWSIGPFVTGHSYLVAGTDRPSNHAFGRAVDVPVVDGRAVSAANTAALDVASMWAALPADLRPDEIGSPWGVRATGVRGFSEGHADHLHAGRDG